MSEQNDKLNKQLGMGLGLMLAGLAAKPRIKCLRPFHWGWWLLGISFCAFIMYQQYKADINPPQDIPIFGLTLPCKIDLVKAEAEKLGLSFSKVDRSPLLILDGDFGKDVEKAWKIGGSLDGNPNVEYILIGTDDDGFSIVVNGKFKNSKLTGGWDWDRYCDLTNVWWRSRRGFHREDGNNTRYEGYKPQFFFNKEDRLLIVAIYNDPTDRCLSFRYTGIYMPKNPLEVHNPNTSRLPGPTLLFSH